ncbi:TPA: hypothetical protein I8Y83_002758 [Legionella pneumophila]|uniref:Transmembrane protein n=1 Tax=Legionella bozemanae TaxID=447 RepID=A0A0W0REQ1_LEGBO|nr:hypothetical protein [Legionella bozemanae]KTC69567.1 hypothetical protein Lboz_3083 [Legionella bozemanae]STP13845.1 Uncharacterised protein [Legionella bozemanae]HAT1722207.1 hypothetical protein [Legionella pneumophila]
MRINLKTPIHYLSFLLLVLSYLSLSFETALKSGVFSSYSDLFTPIIHIFYWPRFALLLSPALVLIILSSVKMKNYEFILKGFFLFTAAVIVSNNISLFSSPNVIPPLNQPQHFIQLYYYASWCKSITWIVIITLGLIWTFQKQPQPLRAQTS